MIKFKVKLMDDILYATGDGIYIDEHGNLHIKNKSGKLTLSCNVRDWIYIKAGEEVEDVHQK